jgi:membrane protease YdiL (CAAX protease family)
MGAIVQAVVLGMVVMLAGTLPRNAAFAANLAFQAEVPWAVPIVAVYLWFFWRYLGGAGGSSASREFRRASLRANRVSARIWMWSLLAGGLGIVALVLGLRIANRLVMLPPQQLPDLSHLPAITIWSLLLMAAPVAGIVEESAFRGYMQGPIERRHGIVPAIVITGTMFAVAHLDFTLMLWPYYVAVAAIYGMVTYRANSIWPAVVLHTAGNLYSNFDLLFNGRAEWQAASSRAELIWSTGVDMTFIRILGLFLSISSMMLWAYRRLWKAAEGQAIG